MRGNHALVPKAWFPRTPSEKGAWGNIKTTLHIAAKDGSAFVHGGRWVNHFPHLFDAASARRNSISTSARQ